MQYLQTVLMSVLYVQILDFLSKFKQAPFETSHPSESTSADLVLCGFGHVFSVDVQMCQSEMKLFTPEAVNDCYSNCRPALQFTISPTHSRALA